jgi:ubiquitin-conjugating enzyme E2 Z
MTEAIEHTPLARRRINAEYQKYLTSNLKEEEHIYCIMNTDNCFNLQAMIVGPKDTPYQGGYYFFDINIPPDYPWSSPNVKYCTQGEDIRFHPNLYICGKVCLSILGTWSGPAWTPIMNLNSVLISLRGLLDDNPIRNEPSFSNHSKTGEIASNYTKIIEYQNINIAVVSMINNLPILFDFFKKNMDNEFVMNYHYFDKYIQDNTNNENVELSSIYGLKTTIKITELKVKIDSLKNKLKIDV